MCETTYLEIAARRLGIAVNQLWDYSEGSDGISFRTPDGYRHTYRFEELEHSPLFPGAAGMDGIRFNSAAPV